ncbi:MAG TPA: SurA N-terminal domain-containing protein [Acidobacteriota bacterium]|nr:SurA N-terminal domain-containing protein [Acidobacteriota bacterium]
MMKPLQDIQPPHLGPTFAVPGGSARRFLLVLLIWLPSLTLVAAQGAGAVPGGSSQPGSAEPPPPAQEADVPESQVGTPGRLADRLAAVVEGEVITLTDIQWLVAYRGLQPPQDSGQLEAFRLSILEQIIEEKLIANEARRTPGVNVRPSDVEQQVEAYRGRFPDEEAFRQQLREMEMAPGDLRSLIARQLAVLRFLRVRFEPFIIVLPDEIRDYYDNRLTPELQESGQPIPNLDLVREEIREILTVEKTNVEIERWVRDQRQKSEVTVLLGRQHPQFSNLPQKAIDQGRIEPLIPESARERP